MILTVYGVYLDGTTAAPGGQGVPYAQKVAFPQGCDGQVNLVVINPAGTAINISAGSLALYVKNRYTDSGNPPISRAGVLDSGPTGLAHFQIFEADTMSPSTLNAGPCQYDVWWTDGSGARHQLVPLSDFEILPSVGLPNTPTTGGASPTGTGYTNEGREPFSSEFSRVITMPIAHVNSTYKVFLSIQVTGGEWVGATYDIADPTHFTINATRSFTGWVVWGTRP